jgi:hypothetical protein
VPSASPAPTASSDSPSSSTPSASPPTSTPPPASAPASYDGSPSSDHDDGPAEPEETPPGRPA